MNKNQKKYTIFILLLLSVLALFALSGCNKKPSVKNKFEGMKTYCEMDDGTWVCDDIVYKFRLEIKGRMPNAAKDSEFVYLSNLPEISFERAWKAAGFSSNTEDYFAPEDAVLVELG